MRAFVVCALGALAATAAAAPHMTSYNVSMLRSELPADSPLLARRPTPNLGYTPASAKLFVYFSAAAYCPQASIMAWSCAACNAIPATTPIAYLYDASLNVAGYVANDNGQPIVSFRGTVSSSLQDWIDDLKFAKTTPMGNCPGCLVHEGFYQSYLSLRSQMLAALNQIGGSSVIVTGHSLGAAIACLAAYDLSSIYSVGTVYTFGQPRVGNPAYASTYAGLISEYRLVHYADIVPHLPFEAMGFHHVPTEVWYNEAQSSYQVCDGSGEDPSCSDSLPLAASISDHLNYLNLPIANLC